MAEHSIKLSWRNTGPEFLKGKYSREHTWTFDGGAVVQASASPSNVPGPWSNPAGVDPEEALIAAASSCHMLTFVWLAFRAGFQCDSYEDEAVGVVAKNETGAPWVSSISLNPRVVYGGPHLPTRGEQEGLHHQAHEQCIIANSVKSDIRIQLPPEPD